MKTIISISEKNAKIKYGEETFIYPLNTISYAVDEQYSGLTLFRNNERIGTSPVESVTVNGVELTPQNIDELLLPLFSEQGEKVTLPIEVGDVNNLQNELDSKQDILPTGVNGQFLYNDSGNIRWVSGMTQPLLDSGTDSNSRTISAKLLKSNLDKYLQKSTTINQGDINVISSNLELTTELENTFSKMTLTPHRFILENNEYGEMGVKVETDKGSLIIDSYNSSTSTNVSIQPESIDLTIPANGTFKVNSKDVATITGALTMLVLTQSEYDAIATKDENTIYFIKE